MTSHSQIDQLIDKAIETRNLTTQDILNLTLARRLNDCSDNTLAQALGGAKPPLNFWNKR